MDVSGLGVLLMVCLAAVAEGAEPRTWTSDKGGHEVEAELVEVTGDSVRLRRADGRVVTTPIKRLSVADREYLSGLADSGASVGPNSGDDASRLAELAERFFADLRTKDRKEAAGLLTSASRELMKAGTSPLLALPSPDKHARAILVGDAEVSVSTAKAPVLVRAGKKRVKTALHFEREDDAWRIAAISAELPGGERTILFDKPIESVKEKEVDPLLALLDKPLPIEGLTLDGERFSSDAYRGKVVLVDFWATWCGPCRKEIPNLLANHAAYHDKGFEIVAVSQDKNLEKLSEFVAETQPPWVVLADRHPKVKQSMGGRYGIRALPSLVLVGRDGKVAAVNCRGKRLGAELKKLLGKPAPRTLASNQ